MKYLLLDKGFDPFSHIEDATYIEAKFSTFKGGEEQVRVTPYEDPEEPITIAARVNSSSDLMRVMVLKDALRRMDSRHVHLYMPYLPYARQDRLMVEGESLACKVFADILNSAGFDSVTVVDAHSHVGPALIENVRCVPNYEVVSHALFHIRNMFENGTLENCVVISPDAGAYKKIFNICDNVKFNGEIVLCSKARDLSTGDILKLNVQGDVTGKSCIIIDDICDGGRTFAELAKGLKEKGAAKVYLIVTHGLFSFGEFQLKWGVTEDKVGPDHPSQNPDLSHRGIVPPYLIDHIWSSNSFREFDSDYISFIQLRA